MLIRDRYWFAYVIIAADELVAVSQTVTFSYNDGRTNLAWTIGQNVDPVVWISLFLMLVIVINMFPVKVYRTSNCNHRTRTLILGSSTLESLSTYLDVSN